MAKPLSHKQPRPNLMEAQNRIKRQKMVKIVNLKKALRKTLKRRRKRRKRKRRRKRTKMLTLTLAALWI